MHYGPWIAALASLASCAAPPQESRAQESRAQESRAQDVRVRDAAGLRSAIAAARPGTRILLAPGEYPGGHHFSDLRGAPGRPIVLGAADPANRPRIVGGGNAFQFSRVAHIEIRDLVLTRATGNGINIDDGGTPGSSHHITLRNLHVSDLPAGNRDGIKLSGLDDFRVENCTVERWGGSGIDMVGCHRGVIIGSTFREGGDNAVQCKGGTSQIAIRGSRFENYGQRAVNVGGSTGLQFFRPPLEPIPPGKRYEAKDISVEGCTFRGGIAPIAFVGVDGATVRFNTFYHPEKWLIRILQETRLPEFVPSRNGVFEDNLVVFRSDRWAEGGVNVGSGTAPQTFRFARNWWYCSDRPDRSRANLPSPETGGVTGRDPQLRDPERGDLGVRAGSPAAGVGAHAWKPVERR